MTFLPKATPFMLRGLYDYDGDGKVDAADQADYAAGLGSVLIDETDIGDGKVPTYNGTSGNLEYEIPSGGGGASTPSDTCLGQPPDFSAPHSYDSVGVTDSYSDSYTKKSCQLTVDVGNLETVYGAGGWELYVLATCSMNNTGSLVCEVYNETDSASLGESTATFSGTGTGNPQEKLIGAFAASLPSSGIKRLRVHWRKVTGDSATTVYFFGPWTLYARKAAA